MSSGFANISVSKKLALGFGVVLVLTGILAVTSWSSLNSLIDRSNWMSDITKLNFKVSILRVARLQYMIAKGDEKVAANVQVALDDFKTYQEFLLGTLKSPENIRVLNKLSAVIADYQKSLNSMRSAYTSSGAMRVQMNVNAEASVRLIDQLQADASKVTPVTEKTMGNYQVITQAKENLMQARYEVRGYTSVLTPEAAQLAMRSVEVAIKGFGEVQSVLGEAEANTVGQIVKSLSNYQTSLQTFKSASDNIASARAEMTGQGQSIVELSEQLYQFQLTQRDAESAQARSVQLGCTLLAMLIGVIAAIVITRQITRPLSETLVVVRRITSGDLSPSAAVSRQDELGQLQQGIQHMGDTLRDLIGGIRDSVVQIASAAEELSAVTEQTSAGVNSQKVETDQVATAMNEMSATVQEVARNAEQASRAASTADAEARAGDKVVSDAIAQIETLAAEVDRSTDAMNQLEAESAKIGKVMDVIKAVAEQTNLLALNAAIEAARAGEAGRGFAVVADEVRGLAQRTQQSTEEIETLIAGLQNGTRQVATIMLSSRALTLSSVDLTRKAGTSLHSITTTVSNIELMNQQIAAAAEQQSAVAEDISRSIVNVRDVSEQTAAASEETAASSIELARLGGQLQKMVSHFKV
ncbi:HAMP domain-containing protein [Pseudomonas sp. MAFF 212408]|uniref:HAMP domain-containing protein n=1 Tax=Pseudomonas kitaguniensis TaxID=2607908 RepID=A0A5N7KJ92_9PSED|nr:methyl-accepting chemotaxis protein [Pseudomonas kitaguniensis]MPR02273.1 HAMP domain-containing protein [Pseudomonas kitaguniensis]